MPRETSSRKYLLTINNPIEHGYTHEKIKEIVNTFSGCIYWCVSDEVGSEGTPHTHIFMYFNTTVMFSTVQKRFFGAHIDQSKGNAQENRNYVAKAGKWADSEKSETSVEGTFEEFGELPDERSARQKQSEAVLEMIKDGKSNADIINAFPSEMNHIQHLEATRQTLLYEKYKNKRRDVEVLYLWGSTGVGKTRFVMDSYGYENVYRISDYEHPFDEYAGQDVMVFEEFRSSLKISKMLIYLDGYPFSLPCRYNNKIACYTKVFIVSNIPLEEQYPEVQRNEPETWNAFRRRIGGVVKADKDTFKDLFANDKKVEEGDWNV